MERKTRLGDWVYIKKGHEVVGWHFLEWSKGKDWFYFKQNEFVYDTDSDGEDLYDSYRYMVTGWQYLEKDGKKNWFYFHPKNGNLLKIGKDQIYLIRLIIIIFNNNKLKNI